jgi:hypothetical protein
VNGYQQRHRRPSSLRGEQLAGEPVTWAAVPIPVFVWVEWADGNVEEVAAEATEWTRRAVHVRWKGGPRIGYEAWVWVGAVRRRPS